VKTPWVLCALRKNAAQYANNAEEDAKEEAYAHVSNQITCVRDAGVRPAHSIFMV